MRGAPAYREFYGRKSELKKVSEALRPDSGVNLVSILGLAGSGKTALALECLKKASDRHAFYYRIQSWDDEAHLLIEIASFLASLGLPGLERRLEDEKGYNLGDIAWQLVTALRKKDCIIVLDDLQKSGGMSRLFTLLKDRGPGGAKIIMCSRERPGFYGLNDLRGEGRVLELKLGPLEKEAVSKILGPKFGEGIIEKIDPAVTGQPIFLQLMKDEDLKGLEGRIGDFIYREVLSPLSGLEKEALDILSVFEHPVLPFIIEEAGKDEVIISLKNRMLVQDSVGGRIQVHDLIKEELRRHAGPNKQNRLLGSAAKRLSDFMDAGEAGLEDVLEYIRILIKLDKGEGALQTLWSWSEELIEYFPTAVEDAALTLEETVGRGGNFKLDVLMGDVNAARGSWEPALSYYRSALKAGPEEGKARIQAKLARAQEKALMWRESIGTYRESIKGFEKEGDRYREGLSRIELASVLRASGRHEKAEEQLEKAETVVQKYPELREAWAFNKALLLAKEGRHSEARETLLEALGDMEKGGNGGEGYVKIVIELARTEMALGMFSLRGLKKGLTRDPEKGGTRSELAATEGYISLGDMANGNGEYGTGKELFETASNLLVRIAESKGLFSILFAPAGRKAEAKVRELRLRAEEGLLTAYVGSGSVKKGVGLLGRASRTYDAREIESLIRTGLKVIRGIEEEDARRGFTLVSSIFDIFAAKKAKCPVAPEAALAVSLTLARLGTELGERKRAEAAVERAVELNKTVGSKQAGRAIKGLEKALGK